jgi:hypothetical protein
MLTRSDWGVGQVQSKGLTHTLSVEQSPVGFHGPRVGGWLVFLNACHRGEDMRIPIGETKIGSSWNNDLVLTGVNVGSFHARIKMGVGEAMIEPTALDRIVKINNTPITQKEPMQDGDLVTIGELHAVFRFSDQMTRGYAPKVNPKPNGMPTQAMNYDMVCGWLVLSKGALLGQDFRIRNGQCRIGSAPDLEISIPDPHLASHALTLQVTPKDCKVIWIVSNHMLIVNGVETFKDTILKESDSISMDHVEGYIKWFR